MKEGSRGWFLPTRRAEVEARSKKQPDRSSKTVAAATMVMMLWSREKVVEDLLSHPCLRSFGRVQEMEVEGHVLPVVLLFPNGLCIVGFWHLAVGPRV